MKLFRNPRSLLPFPFFPTGSTASYRIVEQSSLVRNYVDRLFGIKRPYALTMEDWNEWERDLRHRKPIAWFFTTYVDRLIRRHVVGPIRRWRKAILARLAADYLVDTGLDRWERHDSSDRAIHGLFSLVERIVEREKTNMFFFRLTMKDSFGRSGKVLEEAEKALEEKYRGVSGRDLGLAEVRREQEERDSNGRPTTAALAAERLELVYLWWKDVYPSRPDPYLSYRRHDNKGLMALANAAEKTQADEDTAMMKLAVEAIMYGRDW